MKCNIVRDLLPLYFDGLCSEETCRQLEEHMEQCGDCRQLKQSLEPDKEWGGREPECDTAIEPLKKIKNKMRRKNRLIIMCFILIIFLAGITSLLAYGQIAKKGLSFELVYDALRFQSIGRQFAAGNMEPLFEVLSSGYILRDGESNAVRLAYPDRESYDEDMKAAILEKYQYYFDGKTLHYRGIEEIGYTESARTAWNRALYICLKFTGEEQTEYYIILYKTMDGKYIADDYFGNPYLSYTGGDNPDAETTELLYTDASLFSALPDRQINYDLCMMRELVLASGTRALQGDTALAENGQMRLDLWSEQDRANGTQNLRKEVNEKLSGLAEHGYYMTDILCNVKEYNKSEHRYQYRIYLVFADGNEGEVMLAFDCYRISGMFVFIPGTDSIYEQGASGNAAPPEVIRILEGLFDIPE